MSRGSQITLKDRKQTSAVFAMPAVLGRFWEVSVLPSGLSLKPPGFRNSDDLGLRV